MINLTVMRYQAFLPPVTVFKFLRRRLDGKHLTQFRSYISVFKFPQCSMDGPKSL